MDIKILLLKSLSSKNPISASRRIYYGKSCFIIKYEISGKFVSIKSIKSIRSHKSWTHRIKNYSRVFKIKRCKKFNVCRQKNNFRKFFKNKETSTNINFANKSTSTCIFSEEKGTLTIEVPKLTKEVQTDEVLNGLSLIKETSNVKIFENKETSTNICFENKSTLACIFCEDKESLTIEVPKHTKEVQTEVFNGFPLIKETSIVPLNIKTSANQNRSDTLISKAQQTIGSTRFIAKSVFLNKNKSTKSSQTELKTECRGIQCKRSLQIKSTNTEDISRDSSTEVQNDLFVGGIPTTEPLTSCIRAKDFDVLIYMLNEIGEFVINQNQLLNNNNKIMEKVLEAKRSKNSKSVKSTCRSISTETDQMVVKESKNNFSQTATSYTKPRKLLFLKGRSGQHKNNI